ncbi:hypothetical protein ciss_04880 [Carboxydothermus islandicus]|uniref:Uncharacterized protein n=1 Tax=Carboxydothermus islandicus TaxID=661089 RepID=A0A1L8D046_9THEO|nr:efflux RND transporter permease subunit [Carboxydothermus islandicus]GAV24555.1 hypothetical protein ciss_04880 [Carboxydothermus islandicus]
MNFLTRYSLRNPAVIFLAIVLIVAGGYYSVQQMKFEDMPDIEVPFIWMTVNYPGATPAEVSKEITEPLEKALYGIQGLKNITSYANPSYGVVILEFDYDAKMDKAWQEVSSAIAKVDLPQNAGKIELHKASVNSPDILLFAVEGPGSAEEIAQYVNDKVKPKLSAIAGVEEVKVLGGRERKIFIKLNQDKLKQYQLTPDTVINTLKAANFSIPAGEITIKDKLLPVEVEKEIKSLDEIRNLRLITVDSSKVLKEAFTEVGKSFNEVGLAIGKIGEGLTITQTQIQLLSGIQALEAQIAADQEALLNLTQEGAGPELIIPLQQKIAAEKQKLGELLQKLSQINEEVLKSKPVSGNGSSSRQNSLSTKPELKVITLGDVAEVSEGYETKTTVVRANGHPGVVVALSRQTGANVVEVSDKAKEIIKNLKLPQGYRFTVLYDLADPVKKSVYSMLREALVGALFAVLVIFIFLRSFRATVVAITAIPLSIFASFIILKYLNYTINIMTLAGMAVAVGRVVDDSIVVIENIYRRLAGSNNENVVEEATGEVANAITSSTITTIAVFGPLAMVSGVVGKIFVPFAVTIVVALSFSLLVAVTVVPLTGKLLFRKNIPGEEKEGIIKRGYKRLLHWALKHKVAVLMLATLALVGSVVTLGEIGTNFLPQDKARIYQAKIAMPIGASLEYTDKAVREAEKILAAEKGVRAFQATIHKNGSADVLVVIDNKVKDPNSLADRIAKRLKKISGPKDVSWQPLGTPGGNPMLQVVVNGDDFARVKEGGMLIAEALKSLPGLANVSSNIEDVKPQILVKVDEVKASRKGLTPIMVASSLRAILTGEAVARIDYQGKPTDLVVELKGGSLSSIEDVKNIELLGVTGEKVKLGEIAEVKNQPGPTSLQRRNLEPFVTVSGLITDPNSGKVSEEAQKKISAIKLPEGVTYRFEGNTQMMAEGFADMKRAMLVAVGLVFTVMVGSFGNIKAPLSILFSLPLAVIGAILGLFISGEELGMPALIGGLMLIGIVVTNAIVLVDRVEKQIARGMTLDEALIEAGATRLRPIVMTAATTIFALLPMALFPAEGALISRQMAVVVIGGLLTSTLLTLIVVPVVYRLFCSVTKS